MITYGSFTLHYIITPLPPTTTTEKELQYIKRQNIEMPYIFQNNDILGKKLLKESYELKHYRLVWLNCAILHYIITPILFQDHSVINTSENKYR